jgi:putative hemolysin
MSEIAILTARKVRLQQMAEQGDPKANMALKMGESPNLFLSTVQIGITLVGVLSGAFGGAAIAHQLSAHLTRYPSIAAYSDSIALSLVVIVITYLSLVCGEIVPKRLALASPERIATHMAKPMYFLSVIASPAVRLISGSSDLVLKLIGVRPSGEPTVTEEEIRVLIREATVAGVFETAEQEMVERVFRLGDRSIGAMMTPRQKMVWLDARDPVDKIKRKIANSVYSRFPVCQGRLGNPLGFVHVRDLLKRSLEGFPFDLKACLRKPLYVVENMHSIKVMELFKQTGTQMALVIDEYGTIEGIVTMTDILESIVGDLPSAEHEEELRVIQREDGSLLVDAMLPVDELKSVLSIKHLPGDDTGDYRTVAGFVMTYLKRIPVAGDYFECCGFRFEVVDMDAHRVDKVMIHRAGEDIAEVNE